MLTALLDCQDRADRDLAAGQAISGTNLYLSHPFPWGIRPGFTTRKVNATNCPPTSPPPSSRRCAPPAPPAVLLSP